MDYKKLLPSQKIRFFILKLLGFLPDNMMLPLQYRIKMGRRCNLRNPKTWTEKLQLYKMYYRNPILGRCVDKYEVRHYIEEIGLGDTLVKLYGVYDNAGDIDFNLLPKSFVLKTTDGGGGNNVVIVRDKSLLETDSLRRELNSWINVKDVNPGREWAYTRITKSQIIAEELLVNPSDPDAGIEDFKILCFHGEPKYIIVDKDRYTEHKRNFYDVEWNRVDVTTDHEQFDTPYPQPENFEKMLETAKMLSKDFPFVRVDLYNLSGKIYFGELTFYPWSGYVKFEPEEFDTHLGTLLDEKTFNCK